MNNLNKKITPLHTSDESISVSEVPNASLRGSFQRKRKESDTPTIEIAITRTLSSLTPYIELRNSFRRETVTSLSKLLKEETNSTNLMSICRALGERGPKSVMATSPLVELLAHEDNRVKAAAAEALGSIGATNGEIVESLITLGLISYKQGAISLQSVCTNAVATLAENSPRSIITRIWKIASRDEKYAQVWAACCLAILAKRRSSLLKPSLERLSSYRITSLRSIARTITKLCQ